MVRNSVAVQTGRDPSQATMAFAHVRNSQGPRSFFPEEGKDWFWPNHGVRIGAEVYVFLARLKSTPGEGLGFASAGWELASLSGVDGAPETWKLSRLGTIATSFPTVIGAAVVRESGYVVATAVDEPGDHSVRLVRWAESALTAGDLAKAEWWDGNAWTPQGSLASAPAVVAHQVATELSLSKDPKSGDWLMVASQGFGATDIAMRRSKSLEGPYGAPVIIGRPPESDSEKPFVYAGKAHPELRGADLIVTYAANSFDFNTVVADESLYYPRFMRFGL